jgi:hypothetical protein
MSDQSDPHSREYQGHAGRRGAGRFPTRDLDTPSGAVQPLPGNPLAAIERLSAAPHPSDGCPQSSTEVL